MDTAITGTPYGTAMSPASLACGNGFSGPLLSTTAQTPLPPSLPPPAPVPHRKRPLTEVDKAEIWKYHQLNPLVTHLDIAGRLIAIETHNNFQPLRDPASSGHSPDPRELMNDDHISFLRSREKVGSEGEPPQLMI